MKLCFIYAKLGLNASALWATCYLCFYIGPKAGRKLMVSRWMMEYRGMWALWLVLLGP